MERVSHVGEMRNTYKGLVGNPERKSPLEDSSVNWILSLTG